MRRRLGHLALAILVLVAGVVLAAAAAGSPVRANETPSEGRTAPRPTVCAVLADPALAADGSPLADLVEVALARRSGLRLVNRADLARVLEERRLHLLFNPAGLVERRRVGKILKADVLVCLRPIRQDDADRLEVVVCETAGGLRLLVRTLARSPKPQKDAEAVDALVGEALSRLEEQIAEVCAVPPFVSDDLTHEYDYLQNAYAALIEQMLLAQKGLAVVELAEARAIAEETLLSGSGDGVSRRLPLYFLGGYRHNGSGDTRKVTLALTLKRGEQVTASLNRNDLSPQDAGKALAQMVRELLAKGAGKEAAAPDLKAEARLLAERAATFCRFQNWHEAHALCEASLLANPDQPEVHHMAATALSGIVNSYYDPSGGLENFKQKALAALRYYERYLFHLKYYLRKTTEPRASWKPYCAIDDFERYAREHGADEVMEALAEVRALYKGAYLQVFEARAAEGWLTDQTVDKLSSCVVWDLVDLCDSWPEQAAARLRLIKMVQHLPNASLHTYNFLRGRLDLSHFPEEQYMALLDEAARIPNEAVRKGVGLARREFKEALERARTPRATPSPSPPPPPAPDGNEEVRLRRLPFDGIRDWVPCGPGVDLVWSQRTVYVMKEKGILKQVYNDPDRFLSILDAFYDGKFGWVTLYRTRFTKERQPLVLAVDPVSEQVWEFTAADGVPRPPSGALAPWRPGEACMIVECARGTWCGLLRIMEDGSKAVATFHEARELPEVLSQEQRRGDEPISADVMFFPRFVLPIPGAENESPTGIIVGRDIRDVQGIRLMLVDPARRTLTPLRGRMAGTLATNTIPEVAVHEGALWWCTVGGDTTGMYPTHLDRVMLWRADLAEFRQTSVIEKAPWIPARAYPLNILFHGGRVHLLGYNWWVADRPGDGFRRLPVVGDAAGDMARDLPGQTYSRRTSVSNHYGLIFLETPYGVYQVEFVRIPKTTGVPDQPAPTGDEPAQE